MHAIQKNEDITYYLDTCFYVILYSDICPKIIVLRNKTNMEIVFLHLFLKAAVNNFHTGCAIISVLNYVAFSFVNDCN